MANFIQKFADRREYEASEHQYPNVSLIEDEGLEYTMEQPEPDVLLDANRIKWNVTDGQNRTSVDYPSISFADAQTLINALNNPKDYNVTATINFNYADKTVLENAEVEFNTRESNFEVYAVNGKNQIWVADISLFSNTRAPLYNAVLIDVDNDGNWKTAKWEISYTIENAR